MKKNLVYVIMALWALVSAILVRELGHPVSAIRVIVSAVAWILVTIGLIRLCFRKLD